MTEPTLKPCPFCNTDVNLEITVTETCIKCLRCRLIKCYMNNGEFIDHWNNRPIEEKQFKDGFNACLDIVENIKELYRKDG